MTGTPDSGRLHIVLLGERNSGKSSLLNALAGQQVSIVSDVPGTTTDQVSKAMEIIGLGPCVLLDTAGLDDSGELGGKRVEKSLEALRGADIVLSVIDATTGHIPEIPLKNVPAVPVINKCDLIDSESRERLSAAMSARYGKEAVFVSAISGEGISDVLEAVREAVKDENAEILIISARTESEIAEMEDYDDRQMFLEEMGLEESGVVRLIQGAYHLLGLQTFFTAGADECRAWTIHKGDKAPKAAGVIHSDFEKGFIRAEVIKYDDFVNYKTESAVRAAGKMGVEGKDYVVQDGDIMHFLFNV